METKLEKINHIYSVHSFGYILNTKTNRILKPVFVNGYYKVGISLEGKVDRIYIHRIVAQKFVPNPFSYLTVNHIDGNKLNNNANNLEWCTQKANVQHAYKIGLCPTNIKALQPAKLSEKEVLEIKELLKKKITQKVIATRYNIDQATISNISTRKTWSHIY
jgi:hypothetical protein